MQLFYNPEISEEVKELTFNKEESRHIVRVLRKKEGDVLHITNGRGFLFYVEIIFANDKRCVVKRTSFKEIGNNRDYYLHVAIAPTKNIDRFEWFLEKATEIGIDEITPLLCKNSERKVIKYERLNKIVQSAMKQSLQYRLTKLNNLTSFNDFINSNLEGQLFIAHCEDDNQKNGLKQLVEPRSKYTILIGPEGDFTFEEIEKSKAIGFCPISLGNTRLRTETAGVTSTQNISFLHQ
ncbi:16S rRNA (uracil1498-N3)-methyltransferase [Tenacibaculum sp. MAR_2009_124]|uniref:16S rRNA (uracil(1498)-N(3))-methyltransferase n=1 Tax=Tenacibaculum sp. MAR_2009_124 TaxID=1250059 RepID=UPI00089970D6|nr:16S rRNA (uracil(1498)-N(3))-methyltransferase [Tenacibaculum sp. MAR_2009_124]SEC89703.1 16S rRNA (uracil1498-N3)-methyltransferase [Tenacibaculum sp. MAR_2009_124]